MLIEARPEWPVLLGTCAYRGDGLVTITGPSVTLIVTHDHPLSIVDFLAALNGRRRLSDLVNETSLQPEDIHALLEQLTRNSLLADASLMWPIWFQHISNPLRYTPLDPLAFVSLPRARPRALNVDQVDPLHGVVADLASRRRSIALPDTDHISAPRTSAMARQLCAMSYSTSASRRRSVASAGDLAPLQPFCLTWAPPGRMLFEAAIVNRSPFLARIGELPLAEVAALFAYDELVARALSRGAAVLLLGGDPTRITGKYGDRGWHYMTLECGAVQQQLTLMAAEAGGLVRPIGGYYDKRVNSLIDPFTPLTALLIALPEE